MLRHLANDRRKLAGRHVRTIFLVDIPKLHEDFRPGFGVGTAVKRGELPGLDLSDMKPSSYYDRVVDVCEELVKFTLLTRDASAYLTDRYSERKEEAEKLEQRTRLKSI